MTAGIVAWGTYLPYWRLERTAIGLALGGPAGRGTRTVAAFDEDTTTMAVEAGRVALRVPGRPDPGELIFSTPSPAYVDKTNATAIHAALGLSGSAGAYDLGGSPRSAVAAVGAARSRAAAGRPTLAIVSELRTGLAGGPDERDGGDGAVALLFADHDVVAEVVAEAAASAEFLDRWRTPGETDSKIWEERFGEGEYRALADAAFAAAMKEAGLGPDDVDHLVVTGLHGRAVRAVRSSLGVPTDVLVDDRSSTIGNLGAAAGGMALADVLDRAAADEVIVVLSLADGADATVWRTTPALPAAQAARSRAGVPTLADQVAAGNPGLPYARFLSWRGALRREPPRRPDPERPGAPATRRSDRWKFGFNASRCRNCGFRHLPPARVCLECRHVDEMDLERLADIEGRVATYTVDRLAFSPSPPVVGVVVDFEGGGRYRCEMTDVDPDEVGIGTKVAMTFRRLSTAQGVHNYFWKTKPISGGGA